MSLPDFLPARLRQSLELPVLRSLDLDEGERTKQKTLLQALDLAGMSKSLARLEQLLALGQAWEEAGDCPIVGVCGEINVGKSSTVAGFLSAAGRKRLPRGLGNAQGTHRFVYWLPKSWGENENGRFERTKLLLKSIHGDKHELLSTDPDRAEEQYRAGRNDAAVMMTPLVAFDPELDRLGLGILDCPDVESFRKENGAEPEQRLAFLASAVQLCAAVWVVAKREHIGRAKSLEELLRKLQKSLPNDVPLTLLVNQFRPQRSEDEIASLVADLNEDGWLASHRIDDVYVGYDFSVDRGELSWRSRVPQMLMTRFDELKAQTDEELPQYFRIPYDGTKFDPNAATAEDDLHERPRALATTDRLRILRQTRVAGIAHKIEEYVEESKKEVGRWADESEQRCRVAFEGLLEFCKVQLTDLSTGLPYAVVTKDYAERFSKAIRRTAPWWARPRLAMKSTIDKAKQVGQGLVEAIVGSDSRNDASEPENLQQLLLSCDDLARKMEGKNWVPQETAREDLRRGWEEIRDAFEGWAPQVDDAEFDKLADKFWEKESGDERVAGFAIYASFAAAAMMVAGMAVAIVDGGLTIALTSTAFGLAGVKGVAIAPAVVAALGANVVASATAIAIVTFNLDHSAIPALGCLFAQARGAFGVPKMIVTPKVKYQYRGGESKPFDVPDAVPSTKLIVSLTGGGAWKRI